MSYNEKLADRIREYLVDQKQVDEKRMFTGMCFMVNEKMCICVREDEMLCRIGPDEYEAALEKTGCRPMIHNGKTMTGFVFINDEGMKTKKQFEYWINLALAFNKEAKKNKSKVKSKKSK